MSLGIDGFEVRNVAEGVRGKKGFLRFVVIYSM